MLTIQFDHICVTDKLDKDMTELYIQKHRMQRSST